MSYVVLLSLLLAQPPIPERAPLVRAVDLMIGESAQVVLSDKKEVAVKLLSVKEERDYVRDAVRSARVEVEVEGQKIMLGTGNYLLPQKIAGVQIDCPITSGYYSNVNGDPWGLVKDARLRLWPEGSPLQKPGTFRYPARQRWFASMTQMANEPVYVDGGENPSVRKVYYHYGLDIGGYEDRVEVVAATAGLVVSARTERLPGYEDTPARPRYDVVYLLDDQGWYYRYSHLAVIEPNIKPGVRVTLGQKLGMLGKEGASGGWSHLHFDITSKQPSGKWGIQEGYAFLWEAYQSEHKPKVIAVARPHHVIWAGEKVVLDTSRSWAKAGIAQTHWKFGDGTTSEAPVLERTYKTPGMYAEVLKIVDKEGNVDYDFAIIQVLQKNGTLPPTIHAAYFPTLGIKPGDEVSFKVRTFRSTEGEESWDFGDGTPRVTVKSDGNVKPLAKDGYAATTHRFAKAGQYLVRVERRTNAGTAATYLQVRVGIE